MTSPGFVLQDKLLTKSIQDMQEVVRQDSSNPFGNLRWQDLAVRLRYSTGNACQRILSMANY